MTHYLTVDDLLRIHEAEIGEPIVDLGLLESATLRPQTTVGGMDAYPDLATKAAALLHSLIRNHPFVDGNKRTAVIAMEAFLAVNQVALKADDSEIVSLAVDVAEGHLDVATIAGSLKHWMRPMSVPDSD